MQLTCYVLIVGITMSPVYFNVEPGCNSDGDLTAESAATNKKLFIMEDTLWQKMTPLKIRAVDKEKRTEIVFQESARFYYLPFAGKQAEQILLYLRNSLVNKRKIKVGTQENRNGEAIILKVLVQ